MTQQATNRVPAETRWKFKEFTLAAGVHALQGSGIFLDPAAQTCGIEPGDGRIFLGHAVRAVDATAGALPVNVDMVEEIVLTYFVSGTAADAVAATDVGKDAYLLDDQTVSTLAEGNTLAGRIWDVHATKGIGVHVVRTGNKLATLPAAATLGAFAANDLAPASVVPGATYDVPTTAAASTVTLPAAAADGTEIRFVADGTKNGHTVQYRDATGPTNLTTALLASKRHMVIATKRGGKWFANAYVSP